MKEISYYIGLIIGNLIPIVIVSLIASAILKLSIEKINREKIKYSKAFYLIFISYLISFFAGAYIGEIFNWVGFSRIILICFLFSISTSTILYNFIEVNGAKFEVKEIVVHTSLQTLTVFIIVTLIFISVS